MPRNLGTESEITVVQVVIELRTELLQPDQVGIQTTASYLVAARFRQVGDAETGQQRPDDHHRTAQPCAAPAVVLRTEVVEIDVAGTERVTLLPRLLDLHPHGPQHIDELQNIHDLRNVVQRHLFGGKQRGTDYLKGLVLGPLGNDLAFEAVAALHDEFSHRKFSLFDTDHPDPDTKGTQFTRDGKTFGTGRQLFPPLSGNGL